MVAYKDGTNGTRDFRQTAGLIFLSFIVLGIAYEINDLAIHNTSFPLQIICPLLATAMCIACAVFEPYKHRAANVSGTILPIIFIITSGIYSIVDIYKFSTGMVLLCIALTTLPHYVFYGYGIYWLAKWLKQCTTTTHGEEGVLCRLLRNRNYQLLNAAGGHSRV